MQQLKFAAQSVKLLLLMKNILIGFILLQKFSSYLPWKRKSLIDQGKYHDTKFKLQSYFAHFMENGSDRINSKKLILDDNPELTGKEPIMKLKDEYDSNSNMSEQLQFYWLVDRNFFLKHLNSCEKSIRKSKWSGHFIQLT